jgi:hypothetical protein
MHTVGIKEVPYADGIAGNTFKSKDKGMPGK